MSVYPVANGAPAADVIHAVITRDIAAPREQVFAAWSDVDRLSQWWAPPGYTLPAFTAEVRPGGRYHYCMRDADGGEFWGAGRFLSVVSPERLVFTDGFADAEGNRVEPTTYGLSERWLRESVVTVSFEAIERGTRVTVSQEVVPDDPDTGCLSDYWTAALESIERVVAEG